MEKFVLPCPEAVNCRIGSLENRGRPVGWRISVNCRIGSLESVTLDKVPAKYVNCRIGSLEKYKDFLIF